jgi:hypothetical protein
MSRRVNQPDMSVSSPRRFLAVGALALVVSAVLVLVRGSREHPQTESGRGTPAASPPESLYAPGTADARPARAQAPFVVRDTETDSPGTNLETRVVKFTASVGGTPPLCRQWKVNKGTGFVAVSPTATNEVLVIQNAQIPHTGLYALFATNAAGGTNTTPVPLVVARGVD